MSIYSLFEEMKRTFANSLHDRMPATGQAHNNFRKLFFFVSSLIIDEQNPINA